MMSPK